VIKSDGNFMPTVYLSKGSSLRQDCLPQTKPVKLTIDPLLNFIVEIYRIITDLLFTNVLTLRRIHS